MARRESQNKKILKHLRRGCLITPIEALRLFGCFRLGARIWELREKGFAIKTQIVNQRGKYFAMYSLE